MPRSVTLHIGTMKTGSTLLQSLLKRNRATLRERGICYPATGSLSDHRVMAFAFCPREAGPRAADDPIWGGLEPAVAMAEALARFREEMSQLPPRIDRVILSSEVFSQNVCRLDDMTRLRDLLASFFEQITILIYLRRQDAHVASNYSQALRRGLLDRPSLVAWKDKQTGFTYNYNKLLTPWAEVFGEAAIKPRVFERDTNKSWDVVADFAAAAGTGPLQPPTRAQAPQNPSINAAGQRALREVGWILRGDDPHAGFARTKLWRRLAAEVTAAMPGPGWQPSQEEARQFLARYEAANERVRRRWLPERERLFSDDCAHLPEQRQKPSLDEDLRTVTKVLVHVVRQAMESEDKQGRRIRRGMEVKRALRQNKDDPDARLELARLTMEEGQLLAARRHTDRVLTKAPGHQAARILLQEIDERLAAAKLDEPEIAEAGA